MLSVAKLARGREAYYLETVAPGREGSSVLVEPEGHWLGRAASTLGLVGTVDGAQLTALLAGVDPRTGEVLSAYHHRVRVAAYDCTYSTPKSVSVLHALAPEEIRAQVRAGHEQAAAAALRYLERRGARVRRSLERGQAASSVPAGGFVAAAFLHRTSRAPDPHLHSGIGDSRAQNVRGEFDRSSVRPQCYRPVGVEPPSSGDGPCDASCRS